MGHVLWYQKHKQIREGLYLFRFYAAPSPFVLVFIQSNFKDIFQELSGAFPVKSCIWKFHSVHFEIFFITGLTGCCCPTLSLKNWGKKGRINWIHPWKVYSKWPDNSYFPLRCRAMYPGGSGQFERFYSKLLIDWMTIEWKW